MIERFEITFPSQDGYEKRRAYIYLPKSYYQDEERRYPVLYMFDGHNVFFNSDSTYGKSWGMNKYMNRSRTQLIIAAVECNHSPDNGRLREYSPFSFKDPFFGEITGMGRETMDWFVNEIGRAHV